jgi:hypothetical protein
LYVAEELQEVFMLRKQIVETTLGEVIVALTDEAAPLTCNKRELYGLVSVMLSELLTISEGNSGATGIRWVAGAAA